MNRRHLLTGIGATLVVGSASRLVAKSGTETKSDIGKSTSVVDAALMCLKVGNVCIELCIDLIGKGDKSMLGCLATSRDMVAFGELVVKLSSSNSPQLPEFLKLASKTMEACAKACDEHASHHSACKDCADCCKTAVKAFRA